MNKSALIANAFKRGLMIKERVKCEESLINFVEYAWPVVEPAIPFVRGWAIEAIAEHLEAVAYGDIKRLLVNVPPGFSKSLLTDVFFPAWLWGPLNRPHMRFLCAAYSEHLTVRDNMRCRNIIISDRYQRLWKDRFAVSTDQFTKIKFANNKTGWKLATSVGGVGTGERADIVIVDDPNNPMEMESEAVRETTKMWFTEVLPDRLNNPKESSIVVIQQRTHEEDVSGIALSREMGYTHLMIPMRFDVGRKCVTVLGYDKEGEINWEDPRTEDGELAWPERFTPDVCDGLERDKGPYAWEGQYQQKPEPRGGAIIKRDFWQLWKSDKFPSFEYIVASLDTAYTSKEENDPSALTIWGVFREEEELELGPDVLWMPRNGQVMAPTTGRPKIMLIYAWQGRYQFNELVQQVIHTCTFVKSDLNGPRFPVDKLLIEAKASGLSVAQEIERLVGGTGQIGIDRVNPTLYGDKVARVHAVQHLFSDKMIYAPDRSWADMLIDQAAIFPRGAHDDLVDSMSMALRHLRDSGLALRRQEQMVAAEQELQYSQPAAPLYPC